MVASTRVIVSRDWLSTSLPVGASQDARTSTGYKAMEFLVGTYERPSGRGGAAGVECERRSRGARPTARRVHLRDATPEPVFWVLSSVQSTAITFFAPMMKLPKKACVRRVGFHA